MTAGSKHGEHSGHSHSSRTATVGLIEPQVVARRAYELFQARGGEPGHALEDWLRAEHELMESKDRHQSE